MSFGNYKRKHYIALVDEIDELPFLSDLKRLANKITTITDDSDEQTESSVFYDSLNGAGDEILLGRTESWSVVGQYDPTDPAHRIIASMRRKDDEDRLVWHLIEETNGTFVFGIAKILNPVASGGDAGDKEELSCRITFVKRPDIYSEMPDFPEKGVPIAPKNLETTQEDYDYSLTRLLTWDYGGKEEVLFNIYRNDEKIFQTLDTQYESFYATQGIVHYHVTAENEVGESRPSNVLKFKISTPPKPEFSYTLQKDGIFLEFTSDYFTKFDVYKDDDLLVHTSKNNFFDKNVEHNRVYEYFVVGKAEDFLDNETDKVDVKFEAIILEKPIIEIEEVTQDSVHIAIKNKDDSLTYTFFRDGQPINSLIDTGLTANTTYQYKVCVTDQKNTECSEITVTTKKEAPKVSNLTYSITENPYEINLSWDTTDPDAVYIVNNDTFEQEVTKNEINKINVNSIKNTFFVTPKLDNVIGDAISVVTYARPNPPKAEIKTDDKTATLTITDTQDNVSYIYRHNEQETEIKNKKAVLELDPGTHNIEIFAVVEQGRSSPTVLTAEILEDPITVSEAGVVAKTKNSFTIQFVKTNAEKYKVGIKETGFSNSTVNDTYTFKDLESDTTYTFFIISVIGDKESEAFTSVTSTDSDLGEIVGQGKWGTMDYVTYENSEGYSTCVLGPGETGTDGTPKVNHLIFDGDVKKFNTKSIGNDEIYKKITVNKILATSCSSLFRDSKNKVFDFSNTNTQNVTNMISMFNNAQAEKLDLSNFDTSNVRNMDSMLENAQADIIDISSFNVSRLDPAGGMSGMFKNCQATKIKFGRNFKFQYSHELKGRWIKEDDPDVVFTSESDWTNNYNGTKHAGWYVKDTAQTLEWYEDDLEIEEQSNNTDE